MTPDSRSDVRRYGDLLAAVADECRERPETRAELDADPRAFLAARGAELAPGAELRVAANTPEVFHLVMPANPNDVLADEALAGVAGGTGMTVHREASTISSLSTIPSTVSSASTVRERYT